MAWHAVCPECGFVLAQRELVRGEAAWNQGWRHGIPKDRQFITFRHNRTRREADVKCPCGTVVELQYGHLSEEEIISREAIYVLMVWLFHAVNAAPRIQLNLRPGRELISYRWTRPRQTIAACRRPVYLDIGPCRYADGAHMVLRLNQKYWRGGVLAGSGTLYTAEAFMSWMAHGVELTPWVQPANDQEGA
ncbi:hypothetical protein [Streptomyces sp. NPDC049949]|uniref:hypothetical protein n=1 Tax=Streptomyces sp. NPDC049949 TaxID=3154627 RepID=UPI00342B53F6